MKHCESLIIREKLPYNTFNPPLHPRVAHRPHVAATFYRPERHGLESPIHLNINITTWKPWECPARGGTSSCVQRASVATLTSSF